MNGGKVSTNFSSSVKLSDCCTVDEQEKCDIGVSIEEFNVERPNKHSELSFKLPHALDYGNPSNDTPCYPIKMEMAEGASLDKRLPENPKERTCSLETEVEMQGQYQLEQTKEEGSCCDWEKLISDAVPDVFIFNSSIESVICRGEDNKMVDFDSTSFSLVSHSPEDQVDDLHNAQPISSLHHHHHHQQNPINHLEEVGDGEQKETDYTPQLLPIVYQNKQDSRDLSEKMDHEVGDCISLGKKVQFFLNLSTHLSSLHFSFFFLIVNCNFIKMGKNQIGLRGIVIFIFILNSKFYSITMSKNGVKS